MQQRIITQAYAEEAIKQATIEDLGDGTFAGRVPGLVGVVAYGDNERKCEGELYSVIEDWARYRVLHNRNVPKIGDVDLNTAEARRLVEQYS